MKTGKITAKLRDAVPVCLMVEGKEVKRYKNIDLPDMLKEVEMLDFHFNVPADGKITFEISYAQGVLPEVFPEARAKMTKAEKAAAKEAAKAPAEESGTMEILYNVTGPRRKELAAAVGSFIGAEPKYMKAPTYAFVVEDYTIGRDGTLTGKEKKALVEALAAQGFTAA